MSALGNFFPIDADFAWMMIHSFSGGANEWEIGRCCVGDAVADSLTAKVEAALDDRRGRNLSLWLTDEECMMLACAGQNCQTNDLPKAQRDRIDFWHERWRKWVIPIPASLTPADSKGEHFEGVKSPKEITN